MHAESTACSHYFIFLFFFPRTPTAHQNFFLFSIFCLIFTDFALFFFFFFFFLESDTLSQTSYPTQSSSPRSRGSMHPPLHRPHPKCGHVRRIWIRLDMWWRDCSLRKSFLLIYAD
jgi:hypothetical protein